MEVLVTHSPESPSSEEPKWARVFFAKLCNRALLLEPLFQELEIGVQGPNNRQLFLQLVLCTANLWFGICLDYLQRWRKSIQKQEDL